MDERAPFRADGDRDAAWRECGRRDGHHRQPSRRLALGGVDPSTGSAALVDSHEGSVRWRRRVATEAQRDVRELGRRRARVTPSTEWGEQNEEWLREQAMAYLNVDSAASGTRFVAGAVPSLMRVIAGAAEAVRDRERSRSPRPRRLERRRTGRPSQVSMAKSSRIAWAAARITRCFPSVAAGGLAFDGPYEVYHSVYDTHQFVTLYATRSFRYTTTLVRCSACRLASDGRGRDSARRSGDRIRNRRDTPTRSRVSGEPRVASPAFIEGLGELEQVAAAFSASAGHGRQGRRRGAARDLNRQARSMERAFADPAGLRERPVPSCCTHRIAPTRRSSCPGSLKRSPPAMPAVPKTRRASSKRSSSGGGAALARGVRHSGSRFGYRAELARVSERVALQAATANPRTANREPADTGGV